MRVEDTDQKRTIPGAEARLKSDLQWAGLQWDEGPDVGGPFGPYKQSERLELYRQYSDKLLEAGRAYRCFCPKEMLASEEGNEGGINNPMGINPHDCPHVSKQTSDARVAEGRSHVVRLRLSEKLPGYKDLVYGKVGSLKKGFAQDTILMKSDGWPTYHLACVVDDHLMEITHVIRGTEWVPSTPFHLMLYDAFEWKPPVFGHVGLLTNVKGEKFSKRNADIDLSKFQQMGVLPEALDNFVALLGWSHNGKEDFMTPQQLIDNFSTKFTKGDVKVEFAKLWFLQRKHAIEVISRATSPKDLERDMILPLIESIKMRKPDLVASSNPDKLKEVLFRLLKADSRNWTNAGEFYARHWKTLDTPSRDDLIEVDTPIVRLGHLSHRPSIHALISPTVPNTSLIAIAHNIPALLDAVDSSKPIEDQFKQLSAEFVDMMQPIVEAKIAEESKPLTEEDKESVRKSWVAIVHKYLKWAVVADAPGPDALKLMLVLGKEESVKRLKLAEEVALEAPGFEAWR